MDVDLEQAAQIYWEIRMIYCDIHTHILPGIDDGAADWKMSLGMVKASWKAGVRTIIATPHFLPWKEDNHTGQV